MRDSLQKRAALVRNTTRNRRLRMESLERREMLSGTPIEVTNTNPTGAGSLHQAILDANVLPDEDIILFSLGVLPPEIDLTSSLPPIETPMWIMPAGYYYGGSYSPVAISNTQGNVARGIDINTTGDVVLVGLHFSGFQTNGMRVQDVGELVVEDCQFNNSGEEGVLFAKPGYTDVDVGDVHFYPNNVVDDNGEDGFAFYGEATMLDIGTSHIRGNGTSVEGGDGIHLVRVGDADATVGITTTEILSNQGHGIYLDGCENVGLSYNDIGGNFPLVGHNNPPPAPEPSLGNGGDGLHITGGTTDVNTFRDSFMNNVGDAIEIDDSASHSNRFEYIRTAHNSGEIARFQVNSQHSIPVPSVSGPNYNPLYDWWEFTVNVSAGPYFANSQFEIQYYSGHETNGSMRCSGTLAVTLDSSGSEQRQYNIPRAMFEGSGVWFRVVCLDETTPGVSTTPPPNQTGDTSEFTDFYQLLDAEIVARYVFYNNSHLDQFTSGASVYDDDAIDIAKQPLLDLDDTITSANVTGYSKGINGIMIDIAGLDDVTEITADDFVFRTESHAISPSDIQSVTVRPGAGLNGSNRVTVILTDGIAVNEWLEVALRRDAAAGLPEEDVFYFGNLVGDTNSDRLVNATDLDTVRANWGGTGCFIATGDVNLDDGVDSTDLGLVRGNWSATLDDPDFGTSKGVARKSLIDAAFAEPAKTANSPDPIAGDIENRHSDEIPEFSDSSNSDPDVGSLRFARIDTLFAQFVQEETARWSDETEDISLRPFSQLLQDQFYQMFTVD